MEARDHVLADLAAGRDLLAERLRSPAARAPVLELFDAAGFGVSAPPGALGALGVVAYDVDVVMDHLFDACVAAWGRWDPHRRRVVVVGPARVTAWLAAAPVPRGAGTRTGYVTLPPGVDLDRFGEALAVVWDPLGSGALRALSDAVQATLLLQ